MPAPDFPEQTERYLEGYSSDLLADLCEDLDLSADGSKDARYRRILRAVHRREGWLPQVALPVDVAALTAATVAPFLSWMPMLGGDYEKDFYPAIYDELSEVFGDIVFSELPVAHGNTLKIDFHVGNAGGHGVGVEVKMPTNNGDVQRALGQLDQYQRKYGDNLIILILDDFLKPEIRSFFVEALQARRVATIIR